MRIHHLNTATLCPMSASLVNGRGGLFARARMVCHVLLVESPDGLVLVDTGLGLGDIADPVRLGRRWVRQVSPRLDPEESAVAQVRALGHSAADVRHIVATHLDLDHAGGLPDFPDATVHAHALEHEDAMARRDARGRRRYIPGHFAHGPKWRLFDDGGERWFGFEGVRALAEGNPDILLVPLHGHTRGHTAVAVRDGGRWVLHAGDAYFFHRQMESPPRIPLTLRYFQRRADADRAQRVTNEERLRALKAAHGPEISIFCAHDPVEYDRAVAEPGSRDGGKRWGAAHRV